jgi:hypothetical protein
LWSFAFVLSWFCSPPFVQGEYFLVNKILFTVMSFCFIMQDAVPNALRRLEFLYMENSNTVEDFVREHSTSDWRFGDYPPPIARHGPHRQLGRMYIEIGSEYLGDGPVVHQRAYYAWDPQAPGLPE